MLQFFMFLIFLLKYFDFKLEEVKLNKYGFWFLQLRLLEFSFELQYLIGFLNKKVIGVFCYFLLEKWVQVIYNV